MKKVILMVFLIFSLLMIVYGIGFILNYYLVIKYSIEDCLPLGGKGTFPVVSDRLDEIHALVNNVCFRNGFVLLIIIIEFEA